MNEQQRQVEFIQRAEAAGNALLAALRSCIPRNWTAARLELSVRNARIPELRTITHHLENPVTGEVLAGLPVELFDATSALHDVFTEFDQAWTRSTVDLAFDSDGRLIKNRSEYAYGS